MLSCKDMPLYSLLRKYYSMPIKETALFKHFNIAEQCNPEMRKQLDTPVFFGNADTLAVWGRRYEKDVKRCLEEQKQALAIFFEIFDTDSLKEILKIRSKPPHHY